MSQTNLFGSMASSSESTTASTTTALPRPLILLVHLHILGYPNVNASEYDSDMFNPRCRGLRERVKLMEDITYFLVGNIEGKGVKMILSSYPCRQPSESLAFRTSLTKYLEHIRHRAIYPTGSPSGSQHEDIPGFWWKAVVVRKSLLEEAVGEKFERLILSLSTHALATKIPGSLPLSSTINLRQFQPAAYMRLLSDAQSQFHTWTTSASLISRRESNLQTLRRNLISGTCSTNALKSLPTDRLLALEDAKFNALLTIRQGKIGKTTLLFLKELLGLVASPTVGHPRMGSPVQGKLVDTTNFISSLPSAAARHPASLKKLKQSPFSSSKQLGEGARSQHPGKTHAEIAFGAYIEDKKRVKRALNDALLRCKARESECRRIPHSESLRDCTSVTNSFWVSRRPLSEIDFNPRPSEQLLQETGLGKVHKLLGTESKARLEARIRQIRSQVLPSCSSDLPRTSPQHPPSAVNQQPQTDASSTADPSAPANLSSNVAQPAQILASNPSGSVAGPRSARFSRTNQRSCSPAIFGTFVQDEIDAEVDLLIDETNDLSSDDEDATGGPDSSGCSSSCTTPSTPARTPRARRKTPKVNRIWTTGTPVSKKRCGPFASGDPDATPKPRQSSSALAELFEFDEPPSMRLPSFGSSPSFSIDDSGEYLGRFGNTDDSPGFLNSVTLANGGPLNHGRLHSPEEDCLFEDEPSMTLKEILLSADAGDFDLPEDNEIQDDLSHDESFGWE